MPTSKERFERILRRRPVDMVAMCEEVIAAGRYPLKV
jgi:hypothetical protein